MVRYEDMLVETPYALANVEDRRVWPEHENENQCTYCGVKDGDPWYSVAEITVYRIWTADSLYRPEAERLEQGGQWQWRCGSHPKRVWAPHSHRAPTHLLPEEEHPCEEVDLLTKERCRRKAGTRKFVEGWFCGEHSGSYELLARQRRALGDEDPEAGGDPTA